MPLHNDDEYICPECRAMYLFEQHHRNCIHGFKQKIRAIREKHSWQQLNGVEDVDVHGKTCVKVKDRA